MAKRRSRKLSPEEEDEMLREMDQYQQTKAVTENQRLFNNIHIKINNLSPGQKQLVKQIKEKELIFCTGMAGTGKTYISCAMAIDMVKKYPEKYKKIVLIKSVTTLPEEEIGFLKGTMEEKMEPFMYSFMTNFEKLVGRSTVSKMKSDGLIEIRPIAYLRGSNIDNTITIIDEAQNISKRNIRTIMTRLGRDAKMIFLGDTNQIDMKKPQESSLAYMIENFNDFEEIGFVQMTDADEARNPLIPKLEKRFTELEKK
jgi:phosphate starvation-inducible protein PhoH and related proteins